MSFYFSDIEPDIRRLLNDVGTSPRYTKEKLREYSFRGVRRIHQLRADSRIGDDSSLRGDGSPYVYSYSPAASQAYMNDFDRILGWDRDTYTTLYAKMYTGTTEVRFYTSSADRTGDANEVAEVLRTDSTGVKPVRELNSSGFAGTVNMRSTPANGTEWDILANEQAYELDDFFREPLIDYIVARCYDADSEDFGDADLAVKFERKFMDGLGI